MFFCYNNNILKNDYFLHGTEGNTEVGDVSRSVQTMQTQEYVPEESFSGDGPG